MANDKSKTKAQLIAELEEMRQQRSVDQATDNIREAVLTMRKVEDLCRVIAAIRCSIEASGVEIIGCTIGFLDDGKELSRTYIADVSPRKFGISWTSSDLIEVNEDIVVSVVDEPVPLGLEERIRKDEVFVFNFTYDSQEFAQEYSLERPMPLLAHGTKLINTVIPFAYQGGIGGIGIGSLDLLSEGQIAIVRRFAVTLSQGYLRFLDFQRIDEAQRKLIDELEKELQTAHDMQMGLMPIQSPKISGFDISGRCIPANHVGGDFYQYFDRKGKLSICLADITGHAMKAAIPAVMFDGILKTEIRNDHSLVNLYENLNQTLSEILDSHTFVCFTMGELDPVAKKLQLSNGGCPYPYHFRMASGEISEIELDAYPLGIRSDTNYPVKEIQLEPGDRVVFCSDGIVEAGNSDEEAFGFERIAETIKKGCEENLLTEQLLDYLIAEVKAFTGDTPQGDDQTIVVLAVEA